MPRGPKLSIDEKIARAQERVDKLVEKLNTAKAQVKELEEKRDSASEEELLELVRKSGKTAEEIRAFFGE